MAQISERGSTHVYRVNRLSKEMMDEMISRCIYEQPAYCNAACPLKLDTKAMLKAVAEGDYKKARQLYEKASPFVHILSAGCDAPCQEKCKLGQVGDGIAIREIEKAVARYSVRGKGGSVFRMKKKKTVAVFGSGLFCLFLSGELEKKAYPVTVFCQEADLAQFLAAEAAFLSREAFAAQLADMQAMDLQFQFGCKIDWSFLEQQRGNFDVLCMSEALALQCFPEAVCNPALMVYEKEKLVMGLKGTVLECAYAAKRAALSVDRLAQNLDPANTRGDEGPVETRLYTSTEDVVNTARTPAGTDGYSREAAMAEAARCIQCHCDECRKGCAFLQHYKKYPALLGREIFNNTQIIMGDHQLNKPMNSCSLCGQCTVTCPNGFDMAEVCHLARQNMVSTDKMPLAPHEFALMDMLFSNNEAFLCRKQPGYEQCKYVFFPGCQAAAIAPETVKAAYLDLCQRLEGGVALMLGCCGAICDWAGRYEMYGQTKEFIDRELAKLGDPIIIAGCPTCKKELAAHAQAEPLGIWDILCEIGLPEGAKGLERPAALHDACGARGDTQTQTAIRKLAESLGCQLVETAYSGDKSPCCGYGGLTAYANRELAKEMTDKCLERSDAPYISYCMACRDRFARQGRESRHILELAYGTDAGAPPDISEKRYNRLRLKNELLREIWHEETEEMKLDYELNFTEAALKMMDDRMILKSDVIAVMNAVRQTGEAIWDSEAGLMIARSRLGNATFWVKFTREGDNSYLVHSAYSHRMNVVRRQ